MNISISVANLIAELPRRLHEVVDRQSAIAPKQPAIIDDVTALSFEELRQTTIYAAARLGELGVRAGDRVMVVSENCTAAAVVLLAISRLDAWAIPTRMWNVLRRFERCWVPTSHCWLMQRN